MESTSPRNSLTGHSLKWRCCLLVWPIFLLTKTSFDPLGSYQSSFRLPALENGEGEGAEPKSYDGEKARSSINESVKTTNTTTPIYVQMFTADIFVYSSLQLHISFMLITCTSNIPVDFGVDSLPLVLRVQFWQGRRPAPWGCFLYSISK